jgi:hypothetical protein
MASYFVNQTRQFNRPHTPRGGWDSITGIAMGRAVRGSNPGRSKRFSLLHTRPDQTRGPLSNGYRVSFPSVKRMGRGTDRQPRSSAEVKEIVELHISSPVTGWHFNEKTFTLNTPTDIIHLPRIKTGVNT